MRESHGYYKTRLYSSWCNMKNRCYGKSAKYLKNYGGRGITVCEEWKNSFIAFRDWALRNGYSDELTLDRIDVNSGYSPNNCRWITNKEQQSNKRTNHNVLYKNNQKTVSQWAEIVGISPKGMEKRLKKWTVEKAITTPLIKGEDRRGKMDKRSKPVIQYTLSGEYVKRWDCIKDIVREKGFAECSIISCCKHKHHKAYGFIWRYASDICEGKYKNCDVTVRKDRSIPVIQFAKSGRYIKRWKNAKEACRYTGVAASNIGECCKKHRNSAGGFVWRYEKEVI